MRFGPGSIATLLAEGRSCVARPMRGSVAGAASGVAAVIGRADLRTAAAWLPGRIAIARVSDLSAEDISFLVGAQGETPFAAGVLLIDEEHLPLRLGRLTTAVPVVLAGRSADRTWLERALRVDVSVAPAGRVGAQRPARPTRSSGIAVTLGAPGTVRTTGADH